MLKSTKKFLKLRIVFETDRPIPVVGFIDTASACQVVMESGTRKVRFA